MKTTVINKETRPDLFFLPVDKLDNEGKIIPVLDVDGNDTGEIEKEYTLKAEVDKLIVVDYDVVKRKSAKGIAEFRSYDELTEIWHEIDGKKFKLADHVFYLEYLYKGKWIRSKGSSTQIDEISIAAQDDIIRADVDSETGKYTFSLRKKGYTIRGVWVIRRYDVYDDCFDDLRLDTSDYEGNIDDSDWVDNVRTIIFEEKGVKDKLVVDPYLGVTEESTYINVACDGYYVRVYLSGTENNYWGRLYNDTETSDLGDLFCQVRMNGYGAGCIGQDASRTVTVIQDTPTRVVIEIAGNLYIPGSGYAYNSNSAILRITFYPAYFITEFIWDTDGGDLASSIGNVVAGYYTVLSRITNEQAVYDNNGTEANAVDDTAYNSANYIGYKSDELNLCLVDLYHTNDSNYQQLNRAVTQQFYRWNSGTMSAGVHRMTTAYIVDSENRTYGSTLYTPADRVLIGNEFTNISTDLTTTGSPVTDRNVPATIDTISGFCADGAFHVTSDSNNAGKLTMDRARALFATVIEDWPVMSGDPASPTTHDTCRLKCSDNAASSTIAAATGSNANWEAVSDGGNRNTNTSGDSVDGASGSGLNTQDGTAYIDMSLTGHANAFFKTGAIKIGMQPQFSYDDAADQTLFHVYIDANNYLMCWYDAGNDRFEFTVAWGGTTATVNLTTHTADGTLQVWDTIWCAWDSNDDFLTIWNGRETDAGSNSGTPSSSNPSKFTIGAKQDRSLPGDFIIDDVLTLSDCIRNHGSFIPANIISGDVNYDQAHSNITLYSNSSSLDIGTTSVTDISNISNSAGTIAFQVDPSSSLSTDETLFSAGTSFKIEWINADNDIKFTYGAATVQTSISLPPGLDGKHWIVVRYEASDTISIEVDGLIDSATASTAPTLGSAIAWSSNVGMTKRTITSNPNTPQLWTANGKPLILPDFKSEVA